MRHIRRSSMRRGDFVFFTSGGGVYHVAMYLGRHNGRRIVLHSPHTGSHVKRDAIWTNSWFAGTLRRH
jgi:cell wall-associated NlpC family hydrolase